jgi:hypothetical protein
MDEDPTEVNPFEKQIKRVKIIKSKNYEAEFEQRHNVIEIIILIILFYLFVLEIFSVIYGFVYKGSIDLG